MDASSKDTMIELPQMLGYSARAYLSRYYLNHDIPVPEAIRNLYNPNIYFLEEELSLVKAINVDADALPFLDEFPNLEEVNFYGEGSTKEINLFLREHPNLKTLSIHHAEDLNGLILQPLKSLQTLNITSTNLATIHGLDSLDSLTSLTFIDNQYFVSTDELQSYLLKNLDKLKDCNFDLLLYPEIKQVLEQKGSIHDVRDRINFSEIVSVATERPLTYTFNEAERIYSIAETVKDRYLEPEDSKAQQYAIMYRWVCDHIRYSDASEKFLGQQGSYNALVEGHSICQGYTKAMQVLLKVVNIPSHDIECVINNRGYRVHGETSTGVLGDHSILMVNLGGRGFLDQRLSYNDPTWDAQLIQNGKQARYFMLSKEEISQDHPLVDQENMTIINPPSSSERKRLMEFASQRIEKVNSEIRAETRESFYHEIGKKARDVTRHDPDSEITHEVKHEYSPQTPTPQTPPQYLRKR